MKALLPNSDCHGARATIKDIEEIEKEELAIEKTSARATIKDIEEVKKYVCNCH